MSVRKVDFWFWKQMNVSVGTTSADFGIPLMIHAPSQGGGVCVGDTFCEAKIGRDYVNREKERKRGRILGSKKQKSRGKNVFAVSVFIHCKA